MIAILPGTRPEKIEKQLLWETIVEMAFVPAYEEAHPKREMGCIFLAIVTHFSHIYKIIFKNLENENEII